MGNDVFANGREIACKAGNGKSICAFPDVCFTPPQSPATPPGVPIPYPNTGLARDTTSGSRTVKISGKEVMLKNKSYFKKSLGDEAGCAPKKGVVTSVNRGKVYFTSWSMDVKYEGANVVRHLDLTTHNHGSNSNTLPHPHLDAVAIGSPPECDDLDRTLSATIAEELPDWIRVMRKKSKTGNVIKYDATIAVGLIGSDIVAGASSLSRRIIRASKAVRRGKRYKLHEIAHGVGLAHHPFGNYAEGVKRGDKVPTYIKTCSGKTFRYNNDLPRPHQGHAEAKIIEDWFKSGAFGTLLLNPSKSPCPECSRMINQIVRDGKKKCGRIIVCKSALTR